MDRSFLKSLSDYQKWLKKWLRIPKSDEGVLPAEDAANLKKNAFFQ